MIGDDDTSWRRRWNIIYKLTN